MKQVSGKQSYSAHIKFRVQQDSIHALEICYFCKWSLHHGAMIFLYAFETLKIAPRTSVRILLHVWTMWTHSHVHVNQVMMETFVRMVIMIMHIHTSSE